MYVFFSDENLAINVSEMKKIMYFLKFIKTLLIKYIIWNETNVYLSVIFRRSKKKTN